MDPNNTDDELQHLVEQHGLTKVTAFIPNKSNKKRSNGAERTEKCRKKKKEEGLVQVYIPISDAEAIKAAGSYTAWRKQLWERPSDEEIKQIQKAINLAIKIYKLKAWQRRIISWWLSHNRTTK